MIIPFDIAAVYSGTPVIKRLFDKTVNTVIGGLITNYLSGSDDPTKLASWGLAIPVNGFYLVEYALTVDAAAKVEIGVVKADGTSFIPLFPTYGTEAASGGLVRRHGQNGPIFPDDTGLASSVVTYAAALRVTGAANGTINVGGDISILPRQGV